jgi:molybdopterin-guanine dinucleotide biosynthesis protein A
VSALVVVLAGGHGRRMGAPKPLVELGGRPLVCWPLAAAEGLPAVVVAKADTPLPPLDVPVWLEAAEPVHPLLGIVTALERAGGPVVAVGCDMPFVPRALLARLAVGPESAVDAGPFPARYEPAALPTLRAALERCDSVRATLARLTPRLLDAAAFGDPARILASVNTPGELAAANEWLRGRESPAAGESPPQAGESLRS